MKTSTILNLFTLWGLRVAWTHHHDNKEFTKEELAELEAKWGFEWAFGGIGTFAHLHHVKCLVKPTEPYDIAIIGAPFDTAVTYRPGARFGPWAIRHASGRQHSLRGFNPRANINLYQSWAKIIDCGDIPITPIDNDIAQDQMTRALMQLGKRRTTSSLAPKPKLITLGGDFFQIHQLEALFRRRYRYLSTKGIIEGILSILGTKNPVYLSVDIDVLDPAFAPSTGTPEPGGWTTREFNRILRGIEGLNIVGADVVEVSPVYQGLGEETTFAAAQVVYEILTFIVKRGLDDLGKERKSTKDEL